MRGRMPERPFVLVGQQYLADPQRSVGDVHPLWSYAHVPNGYTGDATEAIIAQIERFAPGFRDRIVGTQRPHRPREFAEYNPNYVGGDIITGAKDIRATGVRPAHGAVPLPGRGSGHVHLLGGHPARPGAHGMCGANAAAAALRHLRRVTPHSNPAPPPRKEPS